MGYARAGCYAALCASVAVRLIWGGSQALAQDTTKEGDTTQVIAQEGDTTQVIAQEGDTTQVIADEGDTTQVITDQGDTTQVIADEGDTTQVIGDEGDTTQSILVGGDETQSISSDATSEGESSDASRTTVAGWARQSLEFYPDDGQRSRESPRLQVPRDRWLSRTQLLIRTSYQKGSWFEATASGALGFSEHVLAPSNTGASRGTDELLDARLMELYLGFFGRRFDLRIGQQRVAWGVADTLSPNDVVNARDLRDPFLSEPEMNHIPTPMVRVSGYWDPFVLELLASPVFVPDRVTLYGRNWAAVQPDTPEAYRGMLGFLRHTSDPSVQDRLNDALYQTRLPNRNGEGVSFGAKLGLRIDGLDANAYYHNGYDGTPYVWIDPAFRNVIENTDFSTASLSDLGPLLRSFDGSAPIVAEYVRRHHVGFDAATTVGSFLLRVDAAYQTKRVFYRSDLTSVISPAALGVASVEYQTGSIDKLVILEGVYIRVLDELSSPLLSYARDSYGFAGVVRWPLVSVFSIEAKGSLGLAPQYFSAQPALIAKVGDVTIKAGALVLNGERNSFGWYNRHNTTVYLQARYGF